MIFLSIYIILLVELDLEVIQPVRAVSTKGRKKNVSDE
jgi:hypothetical protein